MYADSLSKTSSTNLSRLLAMTQSHTFCMSFYCQSILSVGTSNKLTGIYLRRSIFHLIWHPFGDFVWRLDVFSYRFKTRYCFQLSEAYYVFQHFLGQFIFQKKIPAALPPPLQNIKQSAPQLSIVIIKNANFLFGYFCFIVHNSIQRERTNNLLFIFYLKNETVEKDSQNTACVYPSGKNPN